MRIKTKRLQNLASNDGRPCNKLHVEGQGPHPNGLESNLGAASGPCRGVLDAYLETPGSSSATLTAMRLPFTTAVPFATSGLCWRGCSRRLLRRNLVQ